MKLATKRIAAVQPIVDAEILTTAEKRAQPRVPFGALVEGGWLAAGDTLFDKAKQVRARVCAVLTDLCSRITNKKDQFTVLGLPCKISHPAMDGSIGMSAEMAGMCQLIVCVPNIANPCKRID